MILPDPLLIRQWLEQNEEACSDLDHLGAQHDTIDSAVHWVYKALDVLTPPLSEGERALVIATAQVRMLGVQTALIADLAHAQGGIYGQQAAKIAKESIWSVLQSAGLVTLDDTPQPRDTPAQPG